MRHGRRAARRREDHAPARRDRGVPGAAGGGRPAGDGPLRAATRARAATTPTSSAAEQRAARKEASRLERRLETLDRREKQLHEQLAAAATDPARLLELDAELQAVLAEQESVELDWLAAAELAES